MSLFVIPVFNVHLLAQKLSLLSDSQEGAGKWGDGDHVSAVPGVSSGACWSARGQSLSACDRQPGEVTAPRTHTPYRQGVNLKRAQFLVVNHTP